MILLRFLAPKIEIINQPLTGEGAKNSPPDKDSEQLKNCSALRDRFFNISLGVNGAGHRNLSYTKFGFVYKKKILFS